MGPRQGGLGSAASGIVAAKTTATILGKREKLPSVRLRFLELLLSQVQGRIRGRRARLSASGSIPEPDRGSVRRERGGDRGEEGRGRRSEGAGVGRNDGGTAMAFISPVRSSRERFPSVPGSLLTVRRQETERLSFKTFMRRETPGMFRKGEDAPPEGERDLLSSRGPSRVRLLKRQRHRNVRAPLVRGGGGGDSVGDRGKGPPGMWPPRGGCAVTPAAASRRRSPEPEGKRPRPAPGDGSGPQNPDGPESLLQGAQSPTPAEAGSPSPGGRWLSSGTPLPQGSERPGRRGPPREERPTRT